MSIKYIDELTFDIYIKKEFINNIDFNKQENIENYLKEIFKKLNQKYNLCVDGFYNVYIYKDIYYGIIIHIEKEELDYYEYYKNKIEMRIISIETEFMYLVNDIPLNIINKISIENKDNNIYIKLKEELTNIEMMKLLEFSEIVYS